MKQLHRLRLRASNFLLLSVLVLAQITAPLTPFLKTAGATGNNGTLKIHEFGTALGTESNDPKVCRFNFEGFDFDASQSGYIQIAGQGQSDEDFGPFNIFGPADANGFYATSYFNGQNETMIPDGQYKATLYGKSAAGDINLLDEKAKSKVFNIDCVPDIGNLKVNKKFDADGNGSYESENTAANSLGFDWGLDTDVPSRDMGSTYSGIPVGEHTVTETNVPGYKFTGWYSTSSSVNSCLNPKGTTLPVKVTIENKETRNITFCNAFVPELAPSTITIIKEVVLDHEQDFAFSTTGSGLNSFSLDDDADPTITNTKTFSNLGAGSYSVKENNVEGWEMTGINCGQASGVIISGATTTFNLAAGQNVTCTYTNTQQDGSIQVLKQVDEGEGYVAADASSPFKWGLDGGSANRDMGITQGAVDGGNHNVVENSVTDYELVGWYVGSGNCTNAQNSSVVPAIVNVLPGQTTTVTFCNKVEEDKKMTLCHATQSTSNSFATIDVSVSGAYHGHLDDGSGGVHGDHQNGEDIIPPFQFSNQMYSQNWDSSGQAIYRNGCKKQADSKITGYKFHDINGNATKDVLEPKIGGWTIYLYEAGNPSPIASTTTSNSLANYGSYSFKNLESGEYRACEAHPIGWKQIAPDPTDNNGCYIITVDGTNSKTAIFGNQARATIKVYKNVDKNGDGDTEDDHETNNHHWSWGYHGLLDSGNDLTTGDSAQSVRTGLSGSFYLINEDQKDGYDLVDVDCNQNFWRIGDSVKVFATVGDEIECTFTNKKRAEVIIEKKANPEDGTDFRYTLSKENPNKEDDDEDDYDWFPSFSQNNLPQWHSYDKHFILDDAEYDDEDDYTNKETLSLKTGKTYYITEDSVDDWDLDKIYCTRGTEWYRDGNTLVLHVYDTDDIRCWFKNEKQGEVVVTKFNDYDRDGKKDENEPVLSGWDMTLGTEKCNYAEDAVLLSSQYEYNDCDYDYEYHRTQTTGTDGNEEGVTIFSGVKPGVEHTLSENLDGKDGWHWSNTYCEYDQQDGQGYPAGNNNYQLSVVGKTLECFVGNYHDVELTLTKNNNRPAPTMAGDTVTYTLLVSLNDESGALFNTKVTDLPPENFNYVPGSWTANSSVRGDLKANSITPEPSYASPGQWLLGNMTPGEVVTLTYKAIIGHNVTAGVYPDVAFAVGMSLPTDSTQIFSNVSTGADTPFVGTRVTVNIPEVLGVTTLVETGTPFVLHYAGTAMLTILVAFFTTRVRRQAKGGHA